MGKTYGICDFRRGKVGELVFRKVSDKNIISEKPNYYPVNSAWLKKEEFKKYVLSLLDEGIPQIYVLKELPEELYPYALIFVQNEEQNTIYVDKEGIRTEIKIGDNNYDAVNVVENVPQNLNNNVIYYSENQIDEQVVLKNGLKLDKQKSYTYVYEDEKIKQVVPNVDYIAEEQMVFKNKTINGEDNTIQNLIPEDSIKPGYIINKIEESKHYYGYISIEEPKEIVFLDIDGDYITSYVYKAKLENNIITAITSISEGTVYYDGVEFSYEDKTYERYSDVDQVFPILDKSVAYSQAIKTYVDNKTQPIDDITTKSLKNVYNTTLDTNKIVSTDDSGCLKASTIKYSDAKVVIEGVKGNALKNVYNTLLNSGVLVSTDDSGCLKASTIKYSDAKVVIEGVKGNALKNVYNTLLNSGVLVATDGLGCLKASTISEYDTKQVVNNIPTKSLKYAYNTTLDGNKIVVTTAAGDIYSGSLNPDDISALQTNIKTKSLKNVYNKTLTANQNVVTDSSGYLTTAAQPHLYIHKFIYDRGGNGELNFVIYNTQSTSMSLTDIYNFLISIDCNGAWKNYPASGNMADGTVVVGIFASIYNAGSLSQREFSVSFYVGSTAHSERWTYFSDSYSDKVVKIF